MKRHAEPADAPERLRALDPAASFIVQAPAGSGKTALLIQRLLVLLATVTRPEEILAITFTRKAAGEMRARILAALAGARDGIVPEGAFERGVHELAVAVLAHDRDLGWHLLSNPSRLQIMTLDAFNSRLAAAMPVDSGIGGSPRLVENRAQEAIFEEAADAALDWLGDPDPVADDVATIYRHMDSSAPRWRRDIAGMLKRRDQWLPFVTWVFDSGMEDARARSEAMLSDLIADVLVSVDDAFPAAPRREFLELMRYAVDNLRAAGSDHWLAETCVPSSWPSPAPAQQPFWRAVAEFCLTGQAGWRKALNKNLGFPRDGKAQKARFSELIAALSDRPELAERLDQARKLPPASYSDAQWGIIAALLRVLWLAAGELVRLFRERSQSDYTELAAAAMSALHDRDSGGPTDLALALDYRLQHILVDEMQDTSVAQYTFIESLIEGWEPGDGRTLFCVGDPMQSIYRFRAADVSRFLRAWQGGIGRLALNRLRLTTNFRSDAGIVGWVNRTFAQVLGARDNPSLDAVAYKASTPRPGAPNAAEIRVLAQVDDAAGEVERVAAEIGALRKSRPDDTIGLLVRSRAHLEGILAALRQRGIACSTTDIDRLTDLPEVNDLIALTRAIAHPGDRIAWLAVLRAPSIGMPLATIDRIARLPLADAAERRGGEPQVIELLRSDAHRQCIDDVVLAAVDRFLVRYDDALSGLATGSLRDAVEKVWCRMGGPAALRSAAQVENAWRYLDTLESFERAGQLDDVSLLEAQLDDLRVSDVVPGARVQAMTIFKSKGLEFDHVFLPRLDRSTRSSGNAPLAWQTDGEGGGVLLSAAQGADGDGSDPVHEFLNLVSREKSRNELDRLLYVACTRARKSLVLSGNVKTRRNGEVGTAPVDTLLGRLWPVVCDDFESAAGQPGTAAAAQADDPAPLLLPQRRWTEGDWVAPRADLPLSRDARLAPVANDYEVEYDWVGATARRVGTVVHGWLQRLAGRPDPAAYLAGLGDLVPRHARLLRSAGVPARDVDAAAARVSEALANIVDDPDGARILANDHPQSRAEFALSGVVGGQVVTAVIDRVIVDEAGDWWLIDYKTSLHEGGGLEKFFAEEARRYTPQLRRYRELFAASRAAAGDRAPRIRLALYFPLHSHLHPLADAV